MSFVGPGPGYRVEQVAADQVAIEIKQVAAWAWVGHSTVNRGIPVLRNAGLISADLVPTRFGIVSAGACLASTQPRTDGNQYP